MKKIIAISAGQKDYKKEFIPVKSHIRYLNYGLLGLVTILHEKLGLDVLMLQGDNRSIEELITRIEDEGIDIERDCECFLLSIPSYYSISWCAEFCRTVKQSYGKKIVVGGRWCVDGNVEWIKAKLNYVDEVIEGFGEKKLAKLLCPEKAELVPDGASHCFEHLDYRLLLDHQKYQPSVEISRGCGSGCAFCADRGNKKLPNKPVDSVMRELSYLREIYGEFSVYFEAPHFTFNKQWCDEFIRETICSGKIVPWRCTTRVESVPIERIGELAAAGLKIIDIGLESASPTQLLRMNKTPNPLKYLDKASRILKECHKHGVWVKLNILLFAGETYETVEETVSWLKTHKQFIKGVAVSSLVYYKNAADLQELLDMGAKIPTGVSVDDKGYVDLDLSDEISAEDAKKIALDISRTVSNQRDYFDIKSISYFERGYTFEDFEEDIKRCSPEALPFSLE